jgi:hypothetical protein
VEDRIDAYGVLEGRSEGKRPLERPRNSGEDNMKWIFKKCDKGNMDWIHLARDRDR